LIDRYTDIYIYIYVYIGLTLNPSLIGALICHVVEAECDGRVGRGGVERRTEKQMVRLHDEEVFFAYAGRELARCGELIQRETGSFR